MERHGRGEATFSQFARKLAPRPSISANVTKSVSFQAGLDSHSCFGLQGKGLLGVKHN